MITAATPELTKTVQDMIDRRLVHEVHTSERRSYRGCRRRWQWVFQDFYYPQVTAKPLEFGVAFHNAMEVLYDPKTWGWDRELVLGAAIAKFVETCEAQKKKYFQTIGQQYFTSEEVAEDYQDRIELGVGMLKYYAKEVAPQYDEHMTPRAVEVEFIVPIQNPYTDEYIFCKCNRCWKTFADYCVRVLNQDRAEVVELWEASTGLVVCLAGRLDLLAQDQYGLLWVVDWKTAARLSRGEVDGQDRDEYLELDDQIGSYVMALRRKLSLNVRGFVYVELKKAVPEPPERNKTIRLGRMYSVNKMKPVQYETYLATVMAEDKEAYEAGLYDDHLEWLKASGPRYHGRYQIMKTDEELEELEFNLFQEASEMCDPQTRMYPSAGRFSCSSCAFRQPCLEKNRKGDYQYILDTLFDKRERHYWVKELSTDKQSGE